MSIEGLVITIVLSALVLLFLAPTILLSYVLYRIILVRTGPGKWSRECSMPDDAESRQMFDIGLEWAQKHSECRSGVSISNDGFRLEGEYFDFGFEKAVIIIPGRTESCLYSYYFAEPFLTEGYNVLVIDNRSHGLSEGRRSSLGFKEYRDILAWGRFLHSEKGVTSVVLHGICIGASTALFALTSADCPSYFRGMIAEGMYTTFAESFKNHMIVDKRPIFPFFMATMLQIRLLSGANVVSDGPIKRIDQLQKPILFLHSREDLFSLPEKAQILFDKCTSRKTLVWFDKGAHSRIRINNTEAYDNAISCFLRSDIH